MPSLTMVKPTQEEYENYIYEGSFIAGFQDKLIDIKESFEKSEDDEVKNIVSNLEECIDLLQAFSVQGQVKPTLGFPGLFRSAFNKLNQNMEGYLNNNTDANSDLRKKIQKDKELLESYQDAMDEFIEGMGKLEAFNTKYADEPEEWQSDKDNVLKNIGLYGHRPSLEECETMSFENTPMETILDRMIWLSGRDLAVKVRDESSDNIYSNALERLTDELTALSFKDRVDFLILLTTYQNAHLDRLSERFRVFFDSSDKETKEEKEVDAREKLLMDPDADSAIKAYSLNGFMQSKGISNLAVLRPLLSGDRALDAREEYKDIADIACFGVRKSLKEHYANLLKTQKNPPERKERERLANDYDAQTSKQEEEMQLKYTADSPVYKDSGTNQIALLYHKVTEQKTEEGNPFRQVQNAFRQLYSALPSETDNYEAALMTACDSLNTYLDKASESPAETERIKLAKILKFHLERIPELENAQRRTPVQTADERKYNEWFDNFVQQASSLGVDLTKSVGRAMVNWYIDNPEYDPTGDDRHIIQVPAFIPHAGNQSARILFRGNSSQSVNELQNPKAAWIKDTLIPESTEISLYEKKKMYEMAMEGRLFIKDPGNADPIECQVLVKKDGSAGIMQDMEATNLRRENTTAVFPSIVPPGERPQKEAVPKPSAKGTKRFFNAITFGAAFRSELSNYRQKKEKAEREYREKLQKWEERQKEYLKYTTDGKPNEAYVEAVRQYNKNQKWSSDYQQYGKDFVNYEKAQANGSRIRENMKSRWDAVLEKRSSITFGKDLQKKEVLTDQNKDLISPLLDAYNKFKLNIDGLILNGDALNSIGVNTADAGKLKEQQNIIEARKEFIKIMDILTAEDKTDRSEVYYFVYPELRTGRISDEQDSILLRGLMARAKALFAVASPETKEKIIFTGTDVRDIAAGAAVVDHFGEKNGKEYSSILNDHLPDGNDHSIFTDKDDLLGYGMQPLTMKAVREGVAQVEENVRAVNQEIKNLQEKRDARRQHALENLPDAIKEMQNRYDNIMEDSPYKDVLKMAIDSRTRIYLMVETKHGYNTSEIERDMRIVMAERYLFMDSETKDSPANARLEEMEDPKKGIEEIINRDWGKVFDTAVERMKPDTERKKKTGKENEKQPEKVRHFSKVSVGILTGFSKGSLADSICEQNLNETAKITKIAENVKDRIQEIGTAVRH